MARPTRGLAFMRTSTAILNPRSFLDRLLRRDDRLLLDWIAGVAPLFERIAHQRSVRWHRRRALEVQTVHVRLLIDLWIVPRVDDREPPAVGRHVEPFDQTRLRRPETAAGNRSLRKTGCFDDERVSVVAADRMPGGRRGALAGLGVAAAIEIDVPHAAALAREDHFVLLLDEVHAARIRVDEQAAVSAAAPAAAARLRDDDVGNPFRMRTGRVRGATAAPAAVAASTAADAGQELRRRHDAAEAVEAAHAVGIDADPVSVQPSAGCRRRLRADRRRADARQQDRREQRPPSHGDYSFEPAPGAGLAACGA